MRILVVEDDPLLCRALLRRLRGAGFTAEAGHTVVGVEHGDACRAFLAQHGAPDVILMDGNLGTEECGPEVVRSLRAQGCGSTIIMISSDGALSDAGVAAGADGRYEKLQFAMNPMEAFLQLGITVR